MSVQYPFRDCLFLYGASAKAEVVNFVRANCIPEEENSLSQILVEWSKANLRFRDIEQSEKGEAEKIDVKDFSSDVLQRIEEIQSDTLFNQTFSLLPYELRVVDIDRLVAGQRSVNLDYIELLKKSIPPNPSLTYLIEFCLASHPTAKPPAEQMLAPNFYSFTSESLDFRFLGGYRKPLTQDDIKACVGGGFPLSAIVLLVGLGASSMNAFSFAKRIVLNNGFHRAFALRSKGVTHIPIVLQKVSNPQLEFPPVVADLPREYLLGAGRPALIKDFFDPGLTKQLKVKARNKIVQVQWGANQFALPIVG